MSSLSLTNYIKTDCSNFINRLLLNSRIVVVAFCQLCFKEMMMVVVVVVVAFRLQLTAIEFHHHHRRRRHCIIVLAQT